MDSAQDSNPEQEVLADEVNESVGMSHGDTEASSEAHDHHEKKSEDPLYVQKRLKQQKRTHEREIRDLHARMADMQSQMMNQQQQPQQQSMDQSMQGGQPQGVDEQIHKAVSYALQHKEMEQAKAKQQAQQDHVNKQYQELHKHLDNMGDKYDDFDETVRGQDVPITSHMRDAALFLPNEGAGSAGEVLYKLGKNRPELERIANLHPLEQARELNKLSRSLELGGNKLMSKEPPRNLGNIKSNPVVNSAAVTDKTPVSDLRKRMKANWK